MSEAHAAPPSRKSLPAGEGPSGFSSGVVTIPLPRTKGRLVLLKLLARGGMGDVYLAATTGIEGAERPCVVKTVRSDHAHDGSFVARFLDEARVQAQLHHPGVAQVLEADTDEDGEPYTVVEYVEGRSLADVRQRAAKTGVSIGWADAAAVCIEMAQALAHVHERAGADGLPLGIVHRDLSPQNVMIGHAGEVKLIDFGTARGQNRRCHTVAGVVFAKPGYVAPEVARQQVGDSRIDLYALGVMLWELCAGKRLLSGEPQAHLEAVAQGRFTVPELAGRRAVPAEMDRIVGKLCANDPDDRYVTAAQAATDLARVLSQAPTGKTGERSTRSRIAGLMRRLWGDEPARSRAEFARLLKDARATVTREETPPASGLMEARAQRMKDDEDVLPGTPYRPLRKIGEGSSGEVYEAEHVELGRRLALKVLTTAQAATPDALERFRKEARAVAKLSHPNVVALHDFGRALDGRIFFAMELLEGETLDRREEKGMTWQEATRVAVDVTHALEAAHAAGLVHRDLKPQNLFLTSDGAVKLLDFGVATALADGSEPAAQRGFAIFGTPEYMAPEQVEGAAIDGRADLYALGCVLYELVTGARPFEGSSVVVMGKKLREDVERPSVRAPGRRFPRELEAVILKALARDRDDRHPSAAALRADLEAALRAPVRRRNVGLFLTSACLAGCLSVLGVAAARSVVPGLFAEGATAEAIDPGPPVPVEALPPSHDVAPAAQLAATEAPPPEAVELADDAPPAKVTTTSAQLAAAPRGLPALPEPRAEASPEVVHAATGSETPRSELVQARAEARAREADPQALRALAGAALRAGALREARRAAETWAREEPGSVEPRIMLARVHEARGRKSEAKAVLDGWLEAHPESVEARRARARLDDKRR